MYISIQLLGKRLVDWFIGENTVKRDREKKGEMNSVNTNKAVPGLLIAVVEAASIYS